LNLIFTVLGIRIVNHVVLLEFCSSLDCFTYKQ